MRPVQKVPRLIKLNALHATSILLNIIAFKIVSSCINTMIPVMFTFSLAFHIKYE
jgi:hypothetical protein